jgi:FGGY-family pentulose kinase
MKPLEARQFKKVDAPVLLNTMEPQMSDKQVNDKYVIGIDVGTGSARAGVFDAQGHRLATSSQPIQMWQPQPHWAEQSSRDIWDAICRCVRECLSQAKIAPQNVAGISFDATCSLVVLDENGNGLPVNQDGDATRDIIVWMDHRATAETEEINAGEHEVLQYVGGQLSPEMQTPKLLWLKRHLPQTWGNAAQFFDLADFLTWKASGNDSRSLCTVVCKWTYLGHENRWDDSYFRAIGLEDALPRIGKSIGAMGKSLGCLTETAAQELGLSTHCVVGQGIIDAHAGGLGVLGAIWQDENGAPLGDLETSLALIGGTSNCHMAVSREAKFVPGVWGPYFGAMVPGMWLQEGGQSTAGAAIDHAIADHANAARLFEYSKAHHQTVYEVLNEEVERLQNQSGKGPQITRDIHILPDFLGNRSPYADPHARGIYDGISLDASLQSHALRYLATIQAVAYGTRDIVQSMNRAGYDIRNIFVTGGGTKNPLWLQEHADATGATLLLPEESEAVLLGSAILAATAAKLHPNIYAAMKAMSRSGRKVEPRPQFQKFHDAKFGIFQQLYQQQKARRATMSGF